MDVGKAGDDRRNGEWSQGIGYLSRGRERRGGGDIERRRISIEGRRTEGRGRWRMYMNFWSMGVNGRKGQLAKVNEFLERARKRTGGGVRERK